MASTFQDVLDRVKIRFPRTDSVLENMLQTDIFDNFVRNICSQYPYWFLKYSPGDKLPLNFPTDDTDLQSRTPIFGDWLDRGWLRTSPGKNKYVIAAPADLGDPFETDAAYWSNVEVRTVDYVRQYNYNGSLVQDLEIVSSSRYENASNYATQQQPRVVKWESGIVNGETVSWLVFNPVPQKYGIYAVQFHLRVPIDYVSGTSYTNRMLNEYPEVFINAGMLAAAEYFNEQRAIEYYRGILWGIPDDGRIGKQKQREGLIAKMKRDTIAADRQGTYSVPQYLGARAAVGRGGLDRSRYPRRPGIYYQTSW